MKKNKMALIFAGLLVTLIGAGVYVGVKINENNMNNNNENIENLPVDSTQYSYSNVYLSDNQGVLVPLTIKYESFDSLGEELMYVTNMLKVDSKVSGTNFKGLLPSECSVNKLVLEDKHLSIDFNNEFASYDQNIELKLLESLVWTLTDFEEVDSVSLSIDGNSLSNMPVGNTPISNNITKQIGINNYLLTNSMIIGGERVLSYYEKKIDDTYYYVPVTHYVSNKQDLSIYDLTVSTMLIDPGITSSLEVCRCLKDTKLVSSSIVNENILYLSLSEDILFDETTVSLDVYEIFKEVSVLFNDVEDVSFLMELEEVMVNGKQENEETEVSKVELNKYYI